MCVQTVNYYVYMLKITLIWVGIADYRPFWGKDISSNFLSDRLSNKDGWGPGE